MFRDYEFKVRHFLAQKQALCRLEAEICFAQPIKNELEVAQMLLKGFGGN